MGAVSARKDKWTLTTDLVYLDVKQDVNRQRDYLFDRELDITGNVQMKNWIVTPTVGYAVHESDKARIEVLGGLRYLWLKAAADVKFNGVERFNNSTSDSYWDAIVGARATVNRMKNGTCRFTLTLVPVTATAPGRVLPAWVTGLIRSIRSLPTAILITISTRATG